MRRLLPMLALALVAGCGGDDSPAPRTAVGTYPLVTVAGQPLPEIIYEEPGYTLELTAGTITINSNGSFSDTYTIRETIDGTPQPTESGTCNGNWTNSGNTYTLTEIVTDICGDVATATWDGNNTLTVTWNDFSDIPLVHRR